MLARHPIAAAQPSAPPPPPASHGSNGNQSPGGFAPIGGGIEILLVCGAGYGLARKIKKKAPLKVPLIKTNL